MNHPNWSSLADVGAQSGIVQRFRHGAKRLWQFLSTHILPPIDSLVWAGMGVFLLWATIQEKDPLPPGARFISAVLVFAALLFWVLKVVPHQGFKQLVTDGFTAASWLVALIFGGASVGILFSDGSSQGEINNASLILIAVILLATVSWIRSTLPHRRHDKERDRRIDELDKRTTDEINSLKRQISARNPPVRGPAENKGARRFAEVAVVVMVMMKRRSSE